MYNAGASSKVWASDLALFHPLLYTKCKVGPGSISSSFLIHST